MHKIACSVIEIFRDMSDEDYEQKLTVQWTRATVLWLSVLEGCDLQVSSGHHVRAFLQAGDRQGALEVIRDCFGNRSPSTACKRGQDLARFITWLHKKKRSWWPLKEADVLDYLNESKKEGRSKSRGKELASAIRFFKRIMGAFIDLETVLTSLVVGKSNRLASAKVFANRHLPSLWKRSRTSSVGSLRQALLLSATIADVSCLPFLPAVDGVT